MMMVLLILFVFLMFFMLFMLFMVVMGVVFPSGAVVRAVVAVHSAVHAHVRSRAAGSESNQQHQG